MSIQLPKPLIDEITKGRASLFLGAGASLEADFPSAWELAQYLSERAGESVTETIKGRSLDEIAQYLYVQPGYGENWVRRELIDYFENLHRDINRPPSEAHDLMTKIKWRSIFTTNYDRLVEISYDSSPHCVQKVLPIYSPDPQIFRHEADVLRLIKLNGSVDEASRNSSHKLVLTFAEQQDARSYNKELYDLLREEAINGPIIFIGFRFIHPGTNNTGTSPEFTLLQNLLREMGGVARWHYCITPIDEDSPDTEIQKTVLKANKVHIINSTFGDFINELSNNLQKPIEPLHARPPIVVPISDTSLEIEYSDFIKDKRHFEILGSFIENIDPPSVSDTLNGNENWGSFYNKDIIERSSKSRLLNVIRNSVEHKPEILLIGAPPGWGKTFLLRDVAMELYKTHQPVLWLNPYSTMEIQQNNDDAVIISTWDSKRIDRILKQIDTTATKNKIASNKSTSVIIADNCAERTSEILSLFRELASNNRSFILILAVRNNEYELLKNEHPLLNRAQKFQPVVYDEPSEIEELIDFCTKNKVASIEDQSQREIVAQRIRQEKADEALILALQVIFDKNHRPFSEIILEFWKSLESEIAQKITLRVSALHRFGSSFNPRLYSVIKTFPEHTFDEVLDVYKKTLQSPFVLENLEHEEPVVYMLHSLVAEQLIDTCDFPPSEVDDELINLIRCMTGNIRDLEIIRRVLKRVNDYKVNLSTDEKTEKLFRTSATSTKNDWVVCQQFSKYLLKRRDYELAFAWAEQALQKNSDHAPLHHTKGNVLSRWGINLLNEGQEKEGYEKIEAARRCFANSRVRREPDEYGYVTHLDMLRHAINNETDEIRIANLRAEGVRLYNEGLNEISEDRFNLLLEERFPNDFDLSGKATKLLFDRITLALQEGKSSPQSAVYLAEKRFEAEEYNEAIEILERQREITEKGIITWVKEAEFHAKKGEFSRAARCIDTAKRRKEFAEDEETLWKHFYWDLIISFVLEEYKDTKESLRNINISGFRSRQNYPRGYIWNEVARNIKPTNRIFKKHSKIYSGQVDNIRSGGKYGRIRMTNVIGEPFHINFMPQYFSRKDFRRGDHIKFVVAIRSTGLRADDINGDPFVNTTDDVFI